MVRTHQGFTLVELLVVTSIIGFLSSIVTASLQAATLKARLATVQSNFHEMLTASNFLLSDTGSYIGGCPQSDHTPTGSIVLATSTNADDGLSIRPTVGPLTHSYTGLDSCTWSPQAVAAWNGPYLKPTQDPWGHPYYFYPGCQQLITIYAGCPNQVRMLGSLATGTTGACILSLGPSLLPITARIPADCDDLIQVVP